MRMQVVRGAHLPSSRATRGGNRRAMDTDLSPARYLEAYSSACATGETALRPVPLEESASTRDRGIVVLLRIAESPGSAVNFVFPPLSHSFAFAMFWSTLEEERARPLTRTNVLDFLFQNIEPWNVDGDGMRGTI